MVAECWLPNPDKHPMINHINGIKTDNRVENIEWCSASHNVRHAEHHSIFSTRLSVLIPMINHINGIKTDNRVENIEWCSASHNVRHAFANGLNKSTTARAVVICETGQVFPSPRKCVETLGWPHLESAITACCRGDGRKSIKGYTFRKYEPTPLVEKLLKAGFNKYPTSYDEETYYIYLCLAQKWVREEKNIYIQSKICFIKFDWYAQLIKGLSYHPKIICATTHFDSYEEALSAGIDKALELLK